MARIRAWEAAGVGEYLLRAEILEEVDQATARLACVLQRAGSGVVGLAFLVGHVAQGAEGAEILAVAEQHCASVGGPRREGQGTERHGHQHGLHGGSLGPVTQGVAVLDVARLVRNHAEQFIGRTGSEDQAGVDAHDPAAGREGVQVIIVDKQDLDLGGFQSHGGEYRGGPFVNDALDLGIPDRALGRGRRGRRQPDHDGGNSAGRAEGAAG